VGIDLDGTVADYIAGVAPLMWEHYGLEPNYIWDGVGHVRKIENVFGLTSETRPPNLRRHLYEELHLFRNLPKLEDDIEQLTVRLKEKNVKVYFITARAGTRPIKEDTVAWLEENGFQFDDIFYTEYKADLCKLMRIHVMLEDEPSQIIKLQRARINTVVPDQPWNKDLPMDYNALERKRGKIARVTNWREALRITEEFLQ
jgi:uncharacterized HAD superfamily protein